MTTDQPATVGDLSRWISTHGRFTPDRTAIRFEEQDITYAAFHRNINAAAAFLHRHADAAPGERIAYLGFNTPEMLSLLFACARLGAMLVPLNWRLTAAELHRIVADAAPVAIFCDAAHAATAAELADRCPGCRFSEIGELQRADPDLHAPMLGTPDSHVLLVYTSGTTGHPKGALLSQNAILHHTLGMVHMCDLRSDDRILTVLPMFHVGGLNIQTVPAFQVGATVILHRRFEPHPTLEAITSERPTQLVLVPTALHAVMDLPAWPDADLSSLRALTTGSMVVARSLIDTIHDRGIPVIQAYGLTETGPISAYLRAADAFRHPGSAGQAGMFSDLRIVDDRGQDVPAGTAGEIWLRGANLFSGYWRDPSATADAFSQGWLRTGDVASSDEHGNITVLERLKDVIISGGENIYPAEVEELLERIDGIAEAGVIGRPDGRWGEIPVAWIVTEPDSTITGTAIQAALHDRLARYKHPKEIVFTTALPRSALGKIRKEILRERDRRHAAAE